MDFIRNENKKINLSKVLTPYQLEIVNHLATTKINIGAKETAKTFITAIDCLKEFNENKKANIIAAMKYNVDANDKFGEIFNKAKDFLEDKKFDIDFLDVRNGYISGDPNGQFIYFRSFEMINKIAAMVAPNGGYFSHVIVEEPVLANDLGKMHTMKEWNIIKRTIADTCYRSNKDYAIKNNLNKIPNVKWWINMNPWEKEYPVIVEAEKYFPSESFEVFVKDNFLDNHTKSVYVKSIDTLFTRTTKFHQPITNLFERILSLIKINEFWDIEELNAKNIFIKDNKKVQKLFNDFVMKNNLYVEENGKFDFYIELENIDNYLISHLKENNGSILNNCIKAIENKEYDELARLLGFSPDNDLENNTYKYGKIKTFNLEKFDWKNNVILGRSVGWDFDDRRKYVGTLSIPIINIETNKHKVLVLQQKIIDTKGDGKKGVQTDYNFLRYKNTCNELFESLEKNPDAILNIDEFGSYLVLDENKDLMIDSLGSPFSNIANVVKAIKHQSYSILNRQDLLNKWLDDEFILFDENNLELIQKIKNSIIKEGSKQRDESGVREKDYDEINSLEYSIYPWRHLAIKNEME